MKHAWSEPVTLSGEGALTTRRVSFCHQCGVLRSEITNIRSARMGFVYAQTQPNADTLAHAIEPACSLAPERRTKIETHARNFQAARPTFAGSLLAALGAPVPRVEWRTLTDAAGLLHVSRYRPVEAGKRTADLYGPIPTAWCGVPLGLVSWTTIGLAGALERYEEGDAICVSCWEKSGPTRKRDRAAAPMLP
jgi:hypothetical protein